MNPRNVSRRLVETLTLSEIRCSGKMRYASERIATLRASALSAERGVALYVYRCRHCKSWHHTRQAPRRA